MAHKQKGQLTTSGEWAKHLRGFLKKQFWKSERQAAKLMIQDEVKELASLKYKNHIVYEHNNKFRSNFKLTKVESDIVNWRTFYSTDESNWISFYPFSEYHGGGNQYVIMIGLKDFKEWIKNNQDFEKDIRKLLEQINNAI